MLVTCIFTENVTLSQVFFKYFASKNQLPGFYISGTLVENWLIVRNAVLLIYFNIFREIYIFINNYVYSWFLNAFTELKSDITLCCKIQEVIKSWRSLPVSARASRNATIFSLRNFVLCQPISINNKKH